MSDLSFDSASHTYRDGERHLISVTTLLSEVGLFKKGPWYNNPKYRQKGGAVHHLCQGLDQKTHNEADYNPELFSEIAPYGEQFMKFGLDTGAKGRVWEVALALPSHGIAGRLDVIFEVPAVNELWLTDLKTGTVQACAVGCQLAGYEHLACSGEVIVSAMRDFDEEWFTWAKTKKSRLKRKSLNLTPDKYQLRDCSDAVWTSRWRAALTIYGARKEYGLL